MRPAIPAHIDPEALLSVAQLAAAIDWVGQRALREAIKADRVRSRSKPGAQRWARFLVPREFAEDIERLRSCSAPGCELPALADNGSCGQRGHAKAGRPRAPGVYYNLSKTPAAKASKLSLKHAARELGVDRTVLRRRIEAGDVAAERRGRWFLIDPAEVERVKREFVCKEPGCERVALGETGYCGTKGGGHAGAASRVGIRRPPEERKRISETKRRKEKAIVAELRSMGLEPVNTAAASAMYSPHTLRGAGLRERDGVPARGRPPVARIEWLTANGATVPRVVVDPREFGDWYRRVYGSTAVYGRLASTRAAAKGTKVGAPHKLTESELKRVIELRAADPKRWSYRKLADELNEKRAPDTQVSHMTVKNELDRAKQGA